MNFTITFLVSMIIPVALLALTVLAAGRLNGEKVLKNFAKFGYVIMPLDVAARIGHNLFHLLAEGKSVVFTGMTLLGMESHSASPALVSAGNIQILQYVLIALGFAASLYTVYRIARNTQKIERAGRGFPPFAAAITLLAGVNIVLFMLPMAMRM